MIEGHYMDIVLQNGFRCVESLKGGVGAWLLGGGDEALEYSPPIVYHNYIKLLRSSWVCFLLESALQTLLDPIIHTSMNFLYLWTIVL